MTRARRLPILVLIPALVATAWWVQREHDTTPAPAAAVVGSPVPVAAGPDAPGSTWYCAAGSATGVTSGEGAGVAEQSIIISSASDRDLTVNVAVVPEQGDYASKSYSLTAHGRQVVRASDIGRATWASVLVEASGGEITVAHQLTGPAGRSVDTCASAPADSWYFPSGTTRAGTTYRMALFNPFPGDATVDMTFDTEDGTRTPQQLQGIVVPGGRMLMVNVGAVVTLRDRVAASVTVRSGRVIAEQLQTSEGRNGTEQGLTAVLGAPIPSSAWIFPVSAPEGSSALESIAVLNPGDADTVVEIQVQLDDPARNGSVEPFELRVPAHRSAVVSLSGDGRLPASVGRWIIAHSVDGAAVVVSRSVGASRPATVTPTSVAGWAITMGTPVEATHWIGTVAYTTDATAASLVIARPNASSDAIVTVRIHARGRVTSLSGWESVRVRAGERRVVDLARVLASNVDATVEVVSDVPVVVGQWLVLTGPLDVSTIAAIPVLGSVRPPTDLVPPGAGVDLGGSLPDGPSVVDSSSTTSTSSTSSSSTSSTSSSTSSTTTTR